MSADIESWMVKKKKKNEHMKMLQYNKRKQFLHATITHIADLLTSCWMDDEKPGKQKCQNCFACVNHCVASKEYTNLKLI